MNTDKRRSDIPEATACAAGPSACMALSCGVLSAGPMDASLANALSLTPLVSGQACGVASAPVSGALLSACSLDVRCSAAASAALSNGCGLSSTAALPSGMSAGSMGLLARACSRGGLWLDGGKRFAATVMLACAVQMAAAPVMPAWGATYLVNSGQTSTGIELNDNDLMRVYDNGTASSTTINGGVQHVSNGGTASVTTIKDGWQHVSTDGTAISTTISGGGQNVDTGGTATSTTIFNGQQAVFGTATSTFISGGTGQLVFDGGTVSVTTIFNGGSQTVFNNGSATNTTINSGGFQIVSSGGTATGTTINSGGSQNVYTGGTATSTTISGGGQNVDTGGSATSTTIFNGKQFVYGTATSTFISGGSGQLVFSGGTASDTTIFNGGSQTVFNNGSATNTTINSGGFQIVSSGGTATGTTINSGGSQNVYTGGTATSTTINNGGIQDVRGTASNTTISGGTLTIEAGGRATGTLQGHGTVSGSLIVDGGGNLSSLNVHGGTLDVTSGVTVTGSGLAHVSSGGTATNITINDLGVLNVSNGGTAISTTINGGMQNVFDGGTATNTTISGGTLTIEAGGKATGTLQGHGTVSGSLIVDGGGNLSSLNVSGGTLKVTSVTLSAGGSLAVDNDATLSASTISAAGVAFSLNGGTVSATTINGDVSANGGIIGANSITGNLTINGGQVAAVTITDNDISYTTGGLTLGSTDAAPLQQAMAKAGASAGLSVARPTDISNLTGSIKVGADAADPEAGGVSFGSNSVLDVNAGSVADASIPVLKAKNLNIGGNAVLSVSGITTAKSFKAFEATSGTTGAFASVITDSTLFDGVINPDGTVTLREESANTPMPELDPGLAGLLNGAARNGEIGTDDAHIFSKQGGTRFLSRIISRDYGGADPKQASRTLESVARGAVVGAVPQMAMAAANAGANAVAGRMLPSASGGGVLTVSLNDGTLTGLAAGDETTGRHAGFAMWIMPLYQNWTGFGLEGGNYDMDVRGALGGVALGADYTFENAIRAGITFNIGGGYAEGSGDFNSTTNNMSFWGVGLYAGWLPGDFALTADVNFTSVQNRLTQELPAAMQMSDMEADISSWALSAGLRADYTFRTDWLNVTPHAGVRFTHLKVNSYELESGGLTVLEGDDIYQSIWSFPIGVTFARNFGTDSGWQVKPSLDLRVTPHAGDINARGDVRFTGVGGSATMETQTMDYVTYGGTAGLEFGKDNIKMGLNYNLEAGAHSTQHGVFATFRYEF